MEEEGSQGNDRQPQYLDYAGMLNPDGADTDNDKQANKNAPAVFATTVSNPERSTRLDNVSVEGFRAGGRELKGLVEATVEGRPVSLISRKYRADYVEKWQQFRAAGLPVVPTLRVEETNGQKRLLLTDLKAGGSELYGRNLLGTLSDRHRAPGANVDQTFLNLTDDENFRRIEERLAALVGVATKNRIALREPDALELLVRPDGSCDFVFIDLDNADVERSDAHAYQVPKVNQATMELFLAHLQEIRRRLETQEAD